MVLAMPLAGIINTFARYVWTLLAVNGDDRSVEETVAETTTL